MSSGHPERILDERKTGNRVEYLVKRHGTAEPIWEPRIQLMSETHLLKEWQKTKETKESNVEKETMGAPEPPHKKTQSPEKTAKREQKRKPEQPSQSSPSKAAKDDEPQSLTNTTAKASSHTESTAKVIPTTCVGILSLLQPPANAATTKASSTPPVSPQKSAKPQTADYVFVPPPAKGKKTALTPSQREALKDREAVPFYSALDSSRGADDTNLAGLTQSHESMQESGGATETVQLPKRVTAPVLTWDDTVDRKNLLGSNSAALEADEFVTKLKNLLDNAPLKDLNQQQSSEIQTKLNDFLARLSTRQQK